MGAPDPRPHTVTLEQLSEGERRLYDLARTATPLAEIGVRLGLPVPEVDRRLDLLVTRLGLPDRAALREPLPEPLDIDPPDPEASDPFSPPGRGAGDEGASLLSRRSLLLGGGAAATLAAIGGGAVWALRGNGGSEEPSSPAGDPTPTVEPTLDQRSGLDLIEPVDNAFERTTFPAGELVTWAHGIFFMDVDSGVVQGWRMAAPYAAPDTGYLFSYMLPTPRFIEMHSQDQATRLLVDRTEERAWAYPADRLRLVTGTHQALLFEELEPLDGRPAAGSGRYFVTGNDLAEITRFESPRIRFGPDPLVSPDGSRLAAVTVAGEQFALDLFDLHSGARLQSLALPLATTATVNIRWHKELVAATDFAVELRLAADADFGIRTLRVRLPWDAPWPAAIPEGLDHERSVFFSPDGRYELFERSLRTTPAQGLGGGEVWPAVDCHLFGDPLHRVRSATCFYGDVYPSRRFTFGSLDGGLYFTQTASDQTEGPGWERIKYSAWSVRGGVEHPLELPPPVGSEWFHRLQHRGPIPHPTDGSLVAFGRLEVARVLPTALPITGPPIRDIHQVRLASTAGPDHLDPWCGYAKELVFALAHGGHDGGFPGAFIAPTVEEPPFDDDELLRFVVARAGDCVNLRAAPSLDAEVRECLVDGTELTIWPDARGGPEDGVAFVRNEDGAWVAVALNAGSLRAGGALGWISSAYLDWR